MVVLAFKQITIKHNLNLKKHSDLIPQDFRVLQHYFSQCYYKANLEFNLDNRLAIVESPTHH